MYALTIKHPWAWAIAQGLKDYENRVWRPLATLEGYEIAIHAGKSLDKEGERAFQEIMSYLEIPLPTAHQLHFGAIIGTARLGKTVTVGAVDLGLYDETYKCPSCQSIGSHYEVANSDDLCSMACSRCDFTTDIGEDFPTSSGIDLVIAGCESGSGRRPAEAGWFRDVRGQCQAAGVPFYLKQMELCGQVCERPYLDDEQWLQWVEVRG